MSQKRLQHVGDYTIYDKAYFTGVHLLVRNVSVNIP